MAVSRSEAEIADWCRAQLGQILGRPLEPSDADIKFARLGVDSAMSVHLMISLEELLDIDLSPEMFAEHPTITDLAKYLHGLVGQPA
jgi:acyl carrier protein